MKSIFPIIFLFLILGCSTNESNKSNNSRGTERDSSATDSSNSDKITYEFGSLSFTADSSYKLKKSKGSDFSVYTLFNPGIDTFGIYIGDFPQMPSNFSQYIGRHAVESMKKDLYATLSKSGGILSDSSLMYRIAKEKMDSTFLTHPIGFKEIHEQNDKYIWIQRPLSNLKLRIDVIIEFKNSDSLRKPYIHLFGSDELGFNINNPIIQVAKTIRLK